MEEILKSLYAYSIENPFYFVLSVCGLISLVAGVFNIKTVVEMNSVVSLWHSRSYSVKRTMSVIRGIVLFIIPWIC